jgi:hypothetical protein
MAARLPQAGADALGRAAARLEALGPIRRRALLASVIWTVLVAAYAIGFFAASAARGTTFLDGAFFLVTLALPLILVWLAAWLAEELARQRDMIAALADLATPLFAELEATRTELERHGPASPAEVRRAVEAGLQAGRGDATAVAAERILAGQAELGAALDRLRRRIETAPGPAGPAARSAPAARRLRPAPASEPAAQPAGEGQPELPHLAEPAPPDEGLAWDVLVRALDFPRDADDADGFEALRGALRHRRLALLLQAAEDVLTYLAQDGVYVDDLAPDPPDPAAWRRFVAGARGPVVDGVGGVRAEQQLEAARTLMRGDAVFRDTALFFLRRFESVLAALAAEADDAGLVALADTRSGRAFQLMARASGSFD